jgi:hypothetical protein
LFDRFGPLLPRQLRQAQAGEKLAKIADLLGCRDEDEIYRTLVSFWRAPESALAGARDAATAVPDGGLALPGASAAERYMLRDTLCYLPDDILVKLDRAAMAVSLETRAPLLDHRVVAFGRACGSRRASRNRSTWMTLTGPATVIVAEQPEEDPLGEALDVCDPPLTTETPMQELTAATIYAIDLPAPLPDAIDEDRREGIFFVDAWTDADGLGDLLATTRATYARVVDRTRCRASRLWCSKTARRPSRIASPGKSSIQRRLSPPRTPDAGPTPTGKLRWLERTVNTS